MADAVKTPKAVQTEEGQTLTLSGIFSHQVAGHGTLLKAEGGKICKPLVAREDWFYRHLSNAPGHPFHTFVPKWFGCFRASSTDYIVIEDLTASYLRPCLLDIKMGARHYGDHATPEKIEYEKLKATTTTTSTLGLRICGMKVFDVVQDAYLEKNKDAGKKVTKDTIVPHLAAFFHNGRAQRMDVLLRIKQKLNDLLLALRKLDAKDSYRLYSTSLLFVYEGAERDSSSTNAKCDVRMIDFAHVHPLTEGTENDDGYVWGLGNLVGLLERIGNMH